MTTHQIVGGNAMILKLKRYLGNTNNLEAHDTANERTNCQLDTPHGSTVMI